MNVGATRERCKTVRTSPEGGTRQPASCENRSLKTVGRVGQPFRAFWLQFFPFCGFACGFDITGIPLLNYIN